MSDGKGLVASAPESVQSLASALRREQKKVALVQEVSRALSTVGDIDALLRLIMEKVTELMEADRSTLFLVTDDGHQLWSKVIQGSEVVEIRLYVGEGIAGWVAQTREIVNIPDAYADQRFQPAVDLRSGYRTRKGAVCVSGIHEVAKTTTMVMLEGSRVFWDHSGNKAHLLHGNDKDFYLGVVQKLAASAATTVLVNLNAIPMENGLDDGYATINVGSVTTAGTGEGVNLTLIATSEAEKCDALSHRGFALNTPCIVDALINLTVNGSTSDVDINIGLANATHASDADSITESLFCHIDGGSLNIMAESDDGTTEVNATDTTIDAVVGTPFLVQWDLRDWADIQMYINGVNVLPSSVFKLNAATGAADGAFRACL